MHARSYSNFSSHGGIDETGVSSFYYSGELCAWRCFLAVVHLDSHLACAAECFAGAALHISSAGFLALQSAVESALVRLTSPSFTMAAEARNAQPLPRSPPVHH